MRDRMSFRAMRYLKLFPGFPAILSAWCSKVACFAQLAIIFFTPEFCFAISRIFSSIFSQTRGTPRNLVGRTSFRVLTKVPCRALSSANQIVAPP